MSVAFFTGPNATVRRVAISLERQLHDTPHVLLLHDDVLDVYCYMYLVVQCNA